MRSLLCGTSFFCVYASRHEAQHDHGDPEHTENGRDPVGIGLFDKAPVHVLGGHGDMVGTLYGTEIMRPAEEVSHQHVEGEQDGGSSKGEGEELAALMEGHQPYGYKHHKQG